MAGAVEPVGWNVRWVRPLPAMLLLMALAACGAGQGPGGSPLRAAAPAMQAGPIETEAQYRATIVGRDLVRNGDADAAIARHSADGSWLMRQRNHIRAAGTWTWEEGLWCRNGRVAAAGPLPRRCLRLELAGGQLSIAPGLLGDAPETWQIVPPR